MFFCGAKIAVVFQSYIQLKKATSLPGLLEEEREKKVFFSFPLMKKPWDKVLLKKLIWGRYFHFYAWNIGRVEIITQYFLCGWLCSTLREI